MGGAERAPAKRGSGAAWRQVVCRPLWRGATDADIRAVFEGAGYAVARVRLRENAQRQPKDSAVVEFRDEQVAWEAFQRPPAGRGGVALRVEIKAHHNNRKKLALQKAGGAPARTYGRGGVAPPGSGWGGYGLPGRQGGDGPPGAPGGRMGRHQWKRSGRVDAGEPPRGAQGR